MSAKADFNNTLKSGKSNFLYVIFYLRDIAFVCTTLFGKFLLCHSLLQSSLLNENAKLKRLKLFFEFFSFISTAFAVLFFDKLV